MSLGITAPGARSALVVGCFLLSACVSSAAPVDQQSHAGASAAVAMLPDAPSRLRADVTYLADDKMEGREAGEPGFDAAAKYVSLRMKGEGLAPGNGESWFQQVWLRTTSLTPEASKMAIKTTSGGVKELTFLEDFKLYPTLGADEFEIEAPAVFVGYGVYAPELGHNDYEGIDLKGKVVVRFGGAPTHFGSEERAHYGSSRQKAIYMASKGAVGVITLYSEDDARRFPWGRISRNPGARTTGWIGPDGVAGGAGASLKTTAVMNPASSEALFGGTAKSYAELRAAIAAGRAPEAFDLGVTISASGASSFKDFCADNVVGVIEGADPALKDEAVVITAHLDHTGINEHQRGKVDDIINNGAIDNAIGVSMLLETARRFKEGPAPRRTVVFLAVTAEEKGLLGSDYFAHHPTLADKEMVANVNLDMPIMMYSFQDVIAFGAERSSLGPIVKAALGDIGVKVSPDPIPEQNLFVRSDHYSFVKQGVPSVFLVPGFENGGEDVFNAFLSTHYHRPSDEITLPIRWDDAARFADVNYEIAREIADRDERPQWNEGDFFGELFSGRSE